MNNYEIPDELKLESIKVALKDMFNKGYFCICTFDKCADLAGIQPTKEVRLFLAPLHCIHFNTMPKTLVEGIKEVIAMTFSQPALDYSFIDKLQLSYKIEDAEFTEDKKQKIGFFKKIIDRRNG